MSHSRSPVLAPIPTYNATLAPVYHDMETSYPPTSLLPSHVPFDSYSSLASSRQMMDYSFYLESDNLCQLCGQQANNHLNTCHSILPQRMLDYNGQNTQDCTAPYYSTTHPTAWHSASMPYDSNTSMTFTPTPYTDAPYYYAETNTGGSHLTMSDDGTNLFSRPPFPNDERYNH